MANGYVVVDANGDNYGPFLTMERANGFAEFLICGGESCDIVPIVIPEDEWNLELFD